MKFKILRIILIPFIALICGCTNNVASIPKGVSEITFDNKKEFKHDINSKLNINDFKKNSVITELNNEFPIFSVRTNNSNYYTIYSLENNKLCYIIFMTFPETGVDYYVKSVIEYPYKNIDDAQIEEFLLPQDMPRNIIK